MRRIGDPSVCLILPQSITYIAEFSKLLSHFHRSDRILSPLSLQKSLARNTMSDISTRLPESEDDSADERVDEWEQRLYEAKGLDQIRAVINGWRADRSTPDPCRFSQLQQFLKTPIRRGDIPSLVYLLEEEQIELSWTAGLSALNDEIPEDKRPEVLETLYRHGWDFNMRTQASGYTIMR